MQITFLGLLTVAVFTAQFTLCIKKAKLVFRLLPTALILTGLAVCGIVYAAAGDIYGASFSAAIGAMVLAILLIVDGLAWVAAFFASNKK